MRGDTLYVTDLDGTLLDERGQLPAEAADLLRPLADAGIPLTVWHRPLLGQRPPNHRGAGHPASGHTA